jgi:hypothetical protein
VELDEDIAKLVEQLDHAGGRGIDERGWLAGVAPVAASDEAVGVCEPLARAIARGARRGMVIGSKAKKRGTFNHFPASLELFGPFFLCREGSGG